MAMADDPEVWRDDRAGGKLQDCDIPFTVVCAVDVPNQSRSDSSLIVLHVITIGGKGFMPAIRSNNGTIVKNGSACTGKGEGFLRRGRKGRSRTPG